MLHPVILLLASSCVTMQSHVNREYYLINKAMTWAGAQSYCRENYLDLATVGSVDDMERLKNTASGVTAAMWIGLRETRVASWLWSVGETQTSYGLVEYTNWASSPVSSQHCGVMMADGKWLSASCGTEYPFVCQEEFTDEGSGRMHVVLEKKSWRQAQNYCRLKNRDLASVRSQTENKALQQMLDENEPSLSSVWIGLFRDDWEWSDQSDSSFRDWHESQPNNDGNCALYDAYYNRWFDRGCAYSHPFYCYNVKVMRQIIRVEMKSSSFFKFNDSALSEAILNQIQIKYDGVKLQWRVQPDGKIFHQKEKKKVNEGCYKVT